MGGRPPWLKLAANPKQQSMQRPTHTGWSHTPSYIHNNVSNIANQGVVFICKARRRRLQLVSDDHKNKQKFFRFSICIPSSGLLSFNYQNGTQKLHSKTYLLKFTFVALRTDA